MKKLFLVILGTGIAMGCVSLKATPQRAGLFRLFNQIERISPKASPQIYRTHVQELRNANSSVRNCFTILRNHEVNTHFEVLKEESKLSKKEWGEIENIINTLNKCECQPGKIIINSDGNFTQEDQEYIRQQFTKIGRTNVTINLSPVNENIPASISRAMDRDGNMSYSLKMLPGLSSEEKTAVILHEIQGHAAHNDTEITYFPGYYHFIKGYDYKKFPSYLMWVRALEARADQIPAVNATTQEVRCIEKFWEKQKKESIFQQMLYGSDTNSTLLKIINPKSHPLNNERLAMATRIAKLKEAEAQLYKER